MNKVYKWNNIKNQFLSDNIDSNIISYFRYNNNLKRFYIWDFEIQDYLSEGNCFIIFFDMKDKWQQYQVFIDMTFEDFVSLYNKLFKMKAFM